MELLEAIRYCDRTNSTLQNMQTKHTITKDEFGDIILTDLGTESVINDGWEKMYLNFDELLERVSQEALNFGLESVRFHCILDDVTIMEYVNFDEFISILPSLPLESSRDIFMVGKFRIISE